MKNRLRARSNLDAMHGKYTRQVLVSCAVTDSTIRLCRKVSHRNPQASFSTLVAGARLVYGAATRGRGLLKFIGTLHNRRGDPLLLLNLLKALNREKKIQKLAVAWSVPSGNIQPTWEELSLEEKQIQETLRSCVRMVHESSLSWDSKSFLGRCYRSFQYEYMVVLNLKRNRPDLKVILVDDPEVRELRYNEIGRPLEYLKDIERYEAQKQADFLRLRYSAYKTAYENVDKYEEMLTHPDSALLEADIEIGRLTKSREEYMAKVIKESEPQIVILRLMHCISNPSPRLVQLGLTGSKGLLNILGLSVDNVMKLSQAEELVGHFPERD